VCFCLAVLSLLFTTWVRSKQGSSVFAIASLSFVVVLQLAALLLAVVAAARGRIGNGVGLIIGTAGLISLSVYVWVEARPEVDATDKGLPVVAATELHQLEAETHRLQEGWKTAVVATADIKAGTKITHEMVSLVKCPKELIADNAIVRVEDAVGRITRYQINSKEKIRDFDLVAPGQTAVLTQKIPEGMRAVSISGDLVKFVGSGLQPNDHIDIITTYHDPRTEQDVTQIIVGNVLVLAVDENVSDASGLAGGKSSMILAVNPDEVELVKAAERSGTMSVRLIR